MAKLWKKVGIRSARRQIALLRQVFSLLEIPVSSTWETVTLALPNPSATYQICFWAVSFNAEGVYVDDVTVGALGFVSVAETQTIAASVCPNPTTGMVMVEAAADGEVAVFDLFGRQVAEARLVEGRAELDLSGCANGVYVARVMGDAGIATLKLVKE